jgi:hypothetical protein
MQMEQWALQSWLRILDLGRGHHEFLSKQASSCGCSSIQD